jgi:hypothetical protein
MARLGAMSSILSARAEELVETDDAPPPKLVAVRTEDQSAQVPETMEPVADATEAKEAAASPEVADDSIVQTGEEDPGEGDGNDQEEDPAPAAAAPTLTEESKSRKSKATGAKRRTKAEAPLVPAPPAEPNGRAHYTELIRKELRLHPGQSADLTILTVTLHNAKRGRGERITDNTIMRIALDLLLERKHELKGTTEDELRASLGLSPVEYGD